MRILIAALALASCCPKPVVSIDPMFLNGEDRVEWYRSVGWTGDQCLFDDVTGELIAPFFGPFFGDDDFVIAACPNG